LSRRWGFAFALGLLLENVDFGLGTGRDDNDEVANDDKFATDADAKKVGIYNEFGS
jgi:hypothetical protein